MKASKYNICFKKDRRYYVFNQLSCDFREIDAELFDVLKNDRVDLLADAELISDLERGGLICDQSISEESYVIAANKSFRFSKSAVRITVMPTLDCNFHCWYCYETHVPSKMSLEGVQSVISFCKRVIQEGCVSRFVLDWFGGEPLLYFNEIVYPISNEVKKICEKYNVVFHNSITTNGFLITPEIVERMNSVSLNSFQITLDGAKKYHDKTRFSVDRSGSYDTIVRNIIMLCRQITDIHLTLRINHTPTNLPTIDEIAESFPKDVRDKIFVEPQQVWQYKEDINPVDKIVQGKMEKFYRDGYPTRCTMLPQSCIWCYAESMSQYVINHDLNVYKCTARDFVPEKYSIGHISKTGDFVPNHRYYQYYTASFFENERCLDCELLPSCTGMCIQKKLEQSISSCPKQNVKESILNRLMSIVDEQSRQS